MRIFFRHHKGWFFLALALLGLGIPAIFLHGGAVGAVGTPWAFLPIGLTVLFLLLTREVYSSFLLGILSATAVYAGYSPRGMVDSFFSSLTVSVGTTSNICILIFLVLFSALMTLVFCTRGAEAFAAWIERKSSTGRRALLATALLSLLFFFDDYFCVLAGGGFARPLTDKHRVPRSKLAFVLDTTAAPLCILIPATSWSAMIAGTTGRELFLSTIPYNFYAITILLVMLISIAANLDLGAMRRAREAALQADASFRSDSGEEAEVDVVLAKRNGSAVDFLVPMLSFLVFSVAAFFLTGSMAAPSGSFLDVMMSANATVSIVLGCGAALIFTVAFYAIRGVLSFKESMAMLPRGLRQVAPILIALVMTWVFAHLIGAERLGLGSYLGELCGGITGLGWSPLVFFLASAILALATGSSYATFAVFLPIAVAMDASSVMQVLCVSAVLSGAVLGDHASPLSDTTLISSAAADCDLLEHVTTQLPYVAIAALCSGAGYLAGGFAENGGIGLGVALGLLALLLLIMLPAHYSRQRKNRK